MTLAIGLRLFAAISIVTIFKGTNAAPKACRAFGGQPGQCVPFPLCPPLLAVLKSPAITGADINMLKALTCDFEHPKICCSQNDILAPETTAFNNHALPTDEQLQPPSTTPALLNTTEAWAAPLEEAPFIDEDLPTSSSSTTTKKPVDPETDFRAHQNFELLPKINECGSTSTEDNIIGGKEVAHGGHPWMISTPTKSNTTARERSSANDTSFTLCNPCQFLQYSEPPEIIHVAEHNTTQNPDCSRLGCSNAVDYPIEKIIPHPNYNTDDKFNDIGIIRVARDIQFNTFVQPVCLPMKSEYGLRQFPPKASYRNRKGLVAGWGRTRWSRSRRRQYCVAGSVLTFQS